MTISYEWDIETFSCETGDILDHNFTSKLSDYSKEVFENALHEMSQANGEATRIVLVRNQFTISTRGLNKGNEILIRSWAYLNEGKLPRYFDDNEDGYKVPLKFAAEFVSRLLT